MRSSACATERGSALSLMVVVTAITLGGLSVMLLEENRGATTDVARSESQIRALEIAEMGIARSELEIASNIDTDLDGLGNLHGTFANGTYSVTATKNGTDWTLISTGRVANCVRIVEEGVRVGGSSIFNNALFTQVSATLSGSTVTDAFDSRVGDYASQAVNSDKDGTFALSGGNVGSNGSISTSAHIIRGDAIPGPAGTVTGGGTVTGSTTPAASTLFFPPPPLADFTAAYNTNNNGNWSTGAGIVYSAVKKSLTLSGGAVCTLPGGTYFFSSVSLSGGSTLQFTGPSKIYVTTKWDTSGGSLNNASGYAGDLVIYGHPYAFPGIPAKPTVTFKMVGGSGADLCIYAPQSTLSISGGTDVYGSLMVGTATVAGGTNLHYDRRLAVANGPSTVVRTYWVERHPPLW
jgi:hypothetical protein